jgi:shikimate 5-dehydrogenase
LGISPAAPESCALAINTTPLGMGSSDRIPLPVNDWPNLHFALDLVYRAKGTTPWVDACRARGIVAIDGRETLLAQGAASWRLWFPGVTPPWEVMRAALNGRMD